MRLTPWLTMFNSRKLQPRRQHHKSTPTAAAVIESLETRKLLSAATVAPVNTTPTSSTHQAVATTVTTAPTIANVGQGLTYTEGAQPLILAAKATVTDGNNAFASSTLTVDTTNGAAGDQLMILNGDGIGLGPNGAVMFAASQSATPAQIGTVSGGAGNSALVVHFNSSATQAAVQAVIDQIGYGLEVSTPAIPDRKFTFELTDGQGAASAVVAENVHVNAAPVVNNGMPGNPLVYTEGAPPLPVAPTAKISDAPNAYNGSTLNIQVKDGQAGDQLGIAPGNGVGVGANGAVMYAASQSATPVQIGTVTGGTGTTALVVTFNSSATQASVQAVLNQVVYGNGASTLQTPVRQIGIVFTDGNHVSSVPVGVAIQVNPAPVIGNTGTTPVNYAVNANSVALAPKATIADAAGAYANSKLTVQLSGGVSSDRLSIQANGALTLGPNGTLLYNGKAIGTFTGGSGSTALVIQFNANATQAAVNAVTDNITFSYKTTSSSPSLANRLATFTFTDGNGVSSAKTGVGIHVTQ